MIDINDAWDDEEDLQQFGCGRAGEQAAMAETTALPVASACKHCGSTDIFVEREDLSAYQARCNDCGSRGPIVEEGRYYDDEEAGQRDAIIAWNRRAAPSPAPAAPSARFATPDNVVAELWRHLPKTPAMWETVEPLSAPPLWLYEAMEKALTMLPAAPSAAQPDALATEREFSGQLLAMLKKMFDAPTMDAGYAILADFAAQFYPGTPVALQPSQGGSVSEAADDAPTYRIRITPDMTYDQINAAAAAEEARVEALTEAAKRIAWAYWLSLGTLRPDADRDRAWDHLTEAAKQAWLSAARASAPEVVDRLPPGHIVLEQAEMMDGRVSQTVRHRDGSEYQRIVSADEAYGPDEDEAAALRSAGEAANG